MPMIRASALGPPTDYYEFSFGWQHWLSPQIEMRPEVGYYRSIDAMRSRQSDAWYRRQ